MKIDLSNRLGAYDGTLHLVEGRTFGIARSDVV